jgi:hypothetical protein
MGHLTNPFYFLPIFFSPGGSTLAMQHGTFDHPVIACALLRKHHGRAGGEFV